MSYKLLPQACEDVEAIALAIAKDNQKAAEKWLIRIERSFENLASMPLMGVARFDVRSDMRLLAVGDYLVLHRAHENGIDIVRVVHGARQWERLV